MTARHLCPKTSEGLEFPEKSHCRQASFYGLLPATHDSWSRSLRHIVFLLVNPVLFGVIFANRCLHFQPELSLSCQLTTHLRTLCVVRSFSLDCRKPNSSSKKLVPEGAHRQCWRVGLLVVRPLCLSDSSGQTLQIDLVLQLFKEDQNTNRNFKQNQNR